jgi:hypothetical protein
MSGRLGSVPGRLGAWARRAQMLAITPGCVRPLGGARPDQRLLPLTPAASTPARAIGARVAVTRSAVPEGGYALSRPGRRVDRCRVARVEG